MATTYSIHSAGVQMVVMYKECLHNHAAQTMGHFLDGCGLFEASGPNGTTEAMVCAACHCHRNFHRRVEVELPQTIPPPLPQPQLTPASSPRIPDPHPQPHTNQEPSTSHQPTNAPSPVIIGQAIDRAQGMPIRSRSLPNPPFRFSGVQIQEASERQVVERRAEVPRKRLSREQTERLKAISESNNWKLFRHYSKEEIVGVCSEVGITRMALKNWINNQRNKRQSANAATS
ncbi:hypothetical protein BUALT_Bualt15G0086900 [Buddleja alternifolia]|uniref:ZF-HD dimerization-type domain-containing protein n=1 Tax=Buddleja alternifolia TaxID=168488 RepID=A0AAV6WLY6_9LAMI|nr:hypothetical protein BUALT_Bualt15G0086900 [Buddleja alternifolia]